MRKPDIKALAEHTVLITDPAYKPRTGRPANPEVMHLVEKFKRFLPGRDSFFVPDAQLVDVEFLRKPFLRAGLGVCFRHTYDDPSHESPGVRVWRLEGPYDNDF
ncbi:hypothetical protein D3C87_687540 [compost metagenome]